MVCSTALLNSIIFAMCSRAACVVLRDPPEASTEAVQQTHIPGLLAKAKAACHNSDIQSAFRVDPTWSHYSLSDLLIGVGKMYGGRNRSHAVSYACGNHSFAGVWPQSIYCELRREFPNDPSAELRSHRLLEIVKRRIGNTSKNKGVAVHIRMGDVIDDSHDSLEDMLTSQTYFYGNTQAWNRYVMPLEHYRYIEAQLTPGQPVILVGAPHAPDFKEWMQPFYKSCLYTYAIVSYFEQKGYNVQLRIGHLPDDDFVFFVNSKHLFPSGGRYGKLAARLVRLNGGRVHFTPFSGRSAPPRIRTRSQKQSNRTQE